MVATIYGSKFPMCFTKEEVFNFIKDLGCSKIIGPSFLLKPIYEDLIKTTQVIMVNTEDLGYLFLTGKELKDKVNYETSCEGSTEAKNDIENTLFNFDHIDVAFGLFYHKDDKAKDFFEKAKEKLIYTVLIYK